MRRDEPRQRSEPRQYEVWWANLELPAGRRPVLVLHRDEAALFLSRLIVVEITTRLLPSPRVVRLGRAEGLPRESVANFDNLQAVRLSSFLERIGVVSSRRIVELKRALGRALLWDELTDL